MTCPFASMFGTPAVGFHAARIGGLALNDIIGTLALAGLTSYTARIGFMRAAFAWFVAAELLHYAFGVHTAFLQRLGIIPNCDPSPLTGVMKGDDDSRNANKGVELD